jgi:hypothetical protein
MPNRRNSPGGGALRGARHKDISIESQSSRKGMVVGDRYESAERHEGRNDSASVQAGNAVNVGHHQEKLHREDLAEE